MKRDDVEIEDVEVEEVEDDDVDDGDVSKIPHDATTLVRYYRFDFDISVKQLIIVIKSFNPKSGSSKCQPSARSDFQLENKFLDWSKEDSACSTCSIQWIVLRTVGCSSPRTDC